MSSAQSDFLEALASIDVMVAGEGLVDLTEVQARERELDCQLHNNGLRYMRNGVAIALFAALEEFIWARSAEMAGQLSELGIPRENFSEDMHELVDRHAVEVLHRSLSNSDPRGITDSLYEDLAVAWNRRHHGAWRIPHAAFVWTGSNLGRDDFIRPLKALGIVSDWNQIRALMKRISNSPVDVSDFTELAELRHSAAHDAAFDAKLLMLRDKPAKVRELAFCFDAYISTAVHRLRLGSCEGKSGKDAVDLVRFEKKNELYRQLKGSFSSGDRSVKNHKKEDAMLAANRAASSGKVAIFLDRDESDAVSIEKWIVPS